MYSSMHKHVPGEQLVWLLSNYFKYVTFFARVMGVRIASTMTMSSGLSRVPARGPIVDAEMCDPILSIRRAASIFRSLVASPPREERATLNKDNRAIYQQCDA